jgi:hypothetical protein
MMTPHPYAAEECVPLHHRRYDHENTSTSQNHAGRHVENEEKGQDVDEAASLRLKEIDARSFHNRQQMSLIPYLHYTLK